jgi:hypothetical protein
MGKQAWEYESSRYHGDLSAKEGDTPEIELLRDKT